MQENKQTNFQMDQNDEAHYTEQQASVIHSGKHKFVWLLGRFYFPQTKDECV